MGGCEKLSILWDDGSASGVEITSLDAGSHSSLNTFLGHKFKIARRSDQAWDVVVAFSITLDKDVYVVDGGGDDAVCTTEDASFNDYAEDLANMGKLGGA